MIKITLHQAPDINYQITQAAIDQGKIIAVRGLKGDDGNGGDLVAESATRLAADISLTTSVSTEASVRAAAETSISSSVSTEISVRAAAVTSLSTAVVAQTSLRQSADTSISTSVSTEMSVRAAADISVTAAVVAEASTRTAADISLATSVSAEISNRAFADASIVTGLVNKADLVGGKVPSIQLPSFVDDVLEYANFAALPVTGETGKLYITIDNNKQFRWSGSAYSEITSSPGSTDAVPEGATNLYFTNSRAIAALASINSSEASTRLAADISLNTAVSTETSTRTAADISLNTAVSTEMSVRAAADVSSTAATAAEIATRSAADISLTTAVSAEASRAVAAEATKAPASHTHGTSGIDDGAITNVKLANVPTATVKGRKTAGAGVPEDLTMAELTALLNLATSALKGLVPASGGGTTNFLRADMAWQPPPGAGGSGAMELVQLIDAVAAASVAFTLPAGYSHFELVSEDMHASVVTNLKMQVSTDLGATWDTAAQYASAGNRQAGSLLYFGQNSQTSWDLAEYVTNSGSGKNFLHCWLYGARDASNHFKMRSWAGYSNVVAYNGRHADMTHVRAHLSAVNAVKLYLATGNLTGKFRLLGVKI